MLALNLVVRNEHNRIANCLMRAGTYCDELVVVDQESDDDTRDIARRFGALVIEDERRGFPEPSRPLAGAVTKSPWILVLDADEHVVEQAIPEMLEIVGDNSYLGVQFSIGEYVDGERKLERADGTYHPNVHLRMFRKGLVDYGTEVHTRIEMKNSGLSTKLLPQRPAIRNERTRAEWEAADARYAEVMR